MKSRIRFLAVLLFCCSLAANVVAGVYKHVNPDGSVEYTDIPDKTGQKPVEVPPPSTYTPPRLPATKPAARPAFTQYESVAITSPANDTTMRSNDGSLSINVSSKPGLQGGHSYRLLMDGQNVEEGNSGQFKLSNIDRGSHTFTVEIIDEGQTLIQSEAITVHLHRASSIKKSPQKKQ